MLESVQIDAAALQSLVWLVVVSKRLKLNINIVFALGRLFNLIPNGLILLRW